MIESSIYLRTPKYLKSFNSIQRVAEKLRLALFRNIAYGINILYLCKLGNYIDKVDWAHLQELVVLLSKFHCHIIGPSKVTGYSILNYI